MIKKEGGKYCLYTKDGKKKLGCHKTKADAEKQERAIMVQKHSARFIKMKVSSANIRTATYDNREHLVVPVVALMEGVIHAVNAETPELVLAEELSKAPAGWNGRPVVGDHPSRNNQKISANSPEVLEGQSYGILFNTSFEDNKLKTEAWLDPSKAKDTGNAETIERIKKGDMVEVSVGVFVVNEKQEGVHKGKKYNFVWRNIIPDHLAMLPAGMQGACSNDMGCGAPRMNQGKEVNLEWKDKVKDLTVVRSGAAEEVSDVDLRHMLDAALRAIEPGYLGVEAVFDSTVVYAVMPEDEFKLFERKYSIKDSEVNLSGDGIEVKPVTRFEPVTAQKQEEKEEMNEDKAKRVKALIDHPKTIWDETDAKFLQELSECKIKTLEDQVKEPKTEPKVEVKEVEVEKIVEKLPENMTEEEWLKVAPQNLQDIITEHRASEEKKHTDLVASLKEKQEVYSEDELKAMSTVELEKVEKLISKEEPTDASGKDKKFDGKPLPRKDDDNVVPPPPKMEDKIKAMRSA
jgi:hypothetical protein